MISLTVVAVEFAEILPWLAVVVAVLGVGVVVAPRLRRGAPTVPVETARRGPAAVTPEPDMSAPANVEPTVAEPEQVEEETLDLLAVETEHIVEQRGDGDGVDVAPDMRERVGRTRGLFSSAFRSIRGRTEIDADTWDEIEETLLRADLGIGLTRKLLDPLREQAKQAGLRTPDELISALCEAMTAQLSGADRSLRLDVETKPAVWIFVGVNGVGKTTTIGKVATARVADGTTVLMAAGDTFRAAAAEQLKVWSERSGAAFVRGAEGGDPASVVFDGVTSAAARGIDLVLADTAGRLQNKTNLMEELRKVRRVADKAPGTVAEVLLVIDATTGQNGLSQAREFAAATDVTGVVLTKLDGSAKGGIVFAIETELGIPVKMVGLGEGAHDLVTFDPAEFVSALFE
ncbi:MAG: signal recognition particle-docking protein FtsY [Ilumatobacteraceae bacterium]